MSASHASVGRIRQQLAERWPDACPSRLDDAHGGLHTGIPGLDALFPDGCVPSGQWIEITGGESSGKTSLLFTWLAALSRQGTVGYLDFQRSFFPAAASASGVDTRRVLWSKPENPTAGVRMAEWLLGRGVSAVVFDLVGESRPVPDVLCHRLRQKTVRAGALALFLTGPEPRVIGQSMVALRLEVTRRAHAEVEVHVTRGRIAREGVRFSWCVGQGTGTPHGGER